MKLNQIADIRTGLVLSRKKAESKNDIFKYKVLTLKSFIQDGILDTNALEVFESVEELSSEYLTHLNDVVIRLSEPNTAIYISENDEGCVIPSQFCVIRPRVDRLLPEYLSIYLNSKFAKKEISKYQLGSTIPTIQLGFLKELVIKQIDIDTQKRVIEFNKLYLKEKKLLNQLIEEKEKLYSGLIDKILGGR